MSDTIQSCAIPPRSPTRSHRWPMIRRLIAPLGGLAVLGITSLATTAYPQQSQDPGDPQDQAGNNFPSSNQ
jgi:hypothetical protein